MALATLKDLLNDARSGGYAVASFNAWDMLSARNIVAVAQRMKSPVIIAVWQSELDFVGEKETYDVCRSFAEACSVPVAIFIDHATDLESIARSIDMGATSVMIDGSSNPLDENIEITRQATEMAHAAGISCEGEIGVLGEEDGSGEVHALYNNPGEAARFAEETGVDVLAVAIGNAHGFYQQEPKLDFDRLARIAELVSVPLVLHGGTGIPESDVQRAIGMGIAKVNIGAEGRRAYIEGMRDALDADKTEFFYHKLFPVVNVRHQQLIEEKIRMVGSDGKA